MSVTSGADGECGQFVRASGRFPTTDMSGWRPITAVNPSRPEDHRPREGDEFSKLLVSYLHPIDGAPADGAMRRDGHLERSANRTRVPRPYALDRQDRSQFQGALAHAQRRTPRQRKPRRVETPPIVLDFQRDRVFAECEAEADGRGSASWPVGQRLAFPMLSGFLSTPPPRRRALDLDAHRCRCGRWTSRPRPRRRRRFTRCRIYSAESPGPRTPPPRAQRQIPGAVEVSRRDPAATTRTSSAFELMDRAGESLRGGSSISRAAAIAPGDNYTSRASTCAPRRTGRAQRASNTNSQIDVSAAATPW